MHNSLLSADTLKKDEVRNLKGDKIGSIHEIMLDLRSGEVAYLVLSFGGFVGIGDKYFAVPWDAVTVDESEKCVRFDITKEKLEKMPGFDKNDWPDFADETFIQMTRQQIGSVAPQAFSDRASSRF